MKLQTLITVAMLVSVMLDAGMQIDRHTLAAMFKNYSLLGRAFVANFIVVPILAVAFTRLFHVNGEVAAGILLMSIAPGVPFLVRAAGDTSSGALEFAASLTFLMPVLSLATIPLTAALVLPSATQTNLNESQLISTLVAFQLIPLILGMLIADRAPALGKLLARPLSIFSGVMILVLLAAVSPTLAKSVAAVFGSRGILAILGVVVLSIATGWIFAEPPDDMRRMLGTATGLRNFQICVTIAAASFPDTLVMPAVLTYFVVQVVAVLLFGAFVKRNIARSAVATH